MTSLASIADETTATALDAQWLLRAVEPASEYGRRADDAGAPDAAAIAADARALEPSLVAALRDALRATPDAAPALARASVGDALDDAAFLELLRFCDAWLRARALLAAQGRTLGSGAEAEACEELARMLEPGRAGTYGFYLDERFDPALGAARDRARAARAAFESARGRAAAELGATLGRDDLAESEFVLMRSAAPERLPAGVRVLREAPTYLLCTIELDEAGLAALAARDAADAAAADAERRVRERLSSAVRERAAALGGAADAFGALDAHLGKVRYAQRYDCVAAEAGEGIAFDEARYLPLLDELEREGRPYAPISLALDGVAVLTGPNMGGKSVALRTCGFIALAAALGLPVPARSARVAPFARIAWLGIATEQSGGLLSSFAREVVRLRDILARPPERTLVLVDEFARTTTPQEGRALLIALIERLRQRGATGLLATHLPGVAASAGARHFAVRGLRAMPQSRSGDDLAAALAALAEAMDYTLAEVTAGTPPQTDALALAGLLGLDDALIHAAHRHLR